MRVAGQGQGKRASRAVAFASTGPSEIVVAESAAGSLCESQLPGGEVLDKVRSKRAVIAVGASIVILSALILAFWPRLPSVFIALVLQGATGGFLGPAIAAISLGLVGDAALAERLGRNQRFASTGALAGAALMGLVGYLVSYQAIFLIVALLGLPLFFATSKAAKSASFQSQIGATKAAGKVLGAGPTNPHTPFVSPEDHVFSARWPALGEAPTSVGVSFCLGAD